MAWHGTLVVLAPEALAMIATRHASLVTLAILFEAPRFLAMAPLVVEGGTGSVGLGLKKGVRGERRKKVEISEINKKSRDFGNK